MQPLLCNPFAALLQYYGALPYTNVIMACYEDVYTLVGEFGLYQILIACLLTIPGCFMNTFGLFSFVFLAFTPDFRCKLSPSFDNLSLNYTSNRSSQMFYAEENQCSIILNNSISNIFPIDNRTDDFEALHKIKCIGWEYDQSIMQSSWITRWDLVCDRAALPKIAMSIFSVCSLIGVCFFGWVQDRFGRKIASFICCCFYLTGSLLTLVTPDFLSTMAALCLCAFQGISSWNSNYILAVELIGNEKRVNVMFIFCTAYGIGSVLIGGVAYAFQDYWRIQLAISVPFLAMLPLYYFIDESPRWLWANNKFNKSANILNRIGKFAKKDVQPDQIIEVLQKAKKAAGNKSDPDFISPESEFEKHPTILDIFRGRELRAKLILVTLSWFVNSLVYYGIAYNSENVEVNFYLIYMLQAIVDIPASILNLYLMHSIGRVWSLCLGLLLTGICCFGTVTPGAPQWLLILLVMLSKFGVCVSYGVSYQLACELFPTKIRGIATGFCSILGEAGSILMPYVILSAVVDKSLPMVILGFLAIIGGFSAVFLPETKGKPLPDMLEEAEEELFAGRSAFMANCGFKSRQIQKYDYLGLKTIEQ